VTHSNETEGDTETKDSELHQVENEEVAQEEKPEVEETAENEADAPPEGEHQEDEADGAEGAKVEILESAGVV
jgi:hypothetical protein